MQRLNELLGQVSARTVGKDRDLGVDVGSGLERALGLAVLAKAAITGAHANHAVAIKQDRLSREAHEQVDALGLHLLGQPLGELVERDDVVAVILERRRRDRQPELALRRQEVDVVLKHFLGERRALGDEVGNQVTQRRRIEECAR